MKSFGQTVASALKDLRVEAVTLGEKMGFDRRTMVEDANAALNAWEAGRIKQFHFIGDLPNRGRLRAVFALANIFDPMIVGDDGDWVGTLDHEFSILKRFAESKHSTRRRVAA